MILTLPDYKTRARITTADSARDASLSLLLGDVDEAIRNAVRPFHPEPATVTDFVMDAPVGRELLLPVTPARSIASLYLRWGGTGDPSAFEAADLLTQYADYRLEIDRPLEGHSRSGRVVCTNRGGWGALRVRPYGRLADRVVAGPGWVKVTYAAGPTSVPADLQQLATLATSALYAIQPDGMPATSESWNNYSRGWSGPYTAAGFLSTPAALQILQKYQTTAFAVG